MEEKKYMYRVWGEHIQKFEILRVTDKTVYWTTKTGREDYQRRVSDFHNWFETLEDAVTYILNKNESERKIAKQRVSQLENRHQEIIRKYKVKAQNFVGSISELYKTTSVELGDVELEVYNRQKTK